MSGFLNTQPAFSQTFTSTGTMPFGMQPPLLDPFGANNLFPSNTTPLMNSGFVPPISNFVGTGRPSYSKTTQTTTFTQPLVQPQNFTQPFVPPIQPLMQPVPPLVQPLIQPVQPLVNTGRPSFSKTTTTTSFIQPVQPLIQPVQPFIQPVQPLVNTGRPSFSKTTTTFFGPVNTMPLMAPVAPLPQVNNYATSSLIGTGRPSYSKTTTTFSSNLGPMGMLSPNPLMNNAGFGMPLVAPQLF